MCTLPLCNPAHSGTLHSYNCCVAQVTIAQSTRCTMSGLPSQAHDPQFDMVAKFVLDTIDRKAEREIEENIKDNDERVERETDNGYLCHDSMSFYETKFNTVGMMQKMNIKLPTLTQFDG
eukprot:4888573-Amphidinium_carterae.1